MRGQVTSLRNRSASGNYLLRTLPLSRLASSDNESLYMHVWCWPKTQKRKDLHGWALEYLSSEGILLTIYVRP